MLRVKTVFGLFVALVVSTTLAASDVAARRPSADETYTITSTLELVAPFRVADMRDDFQDVRVIKEAKDSATVEITYYPLHQPPVGENPNWKKDYAGMTDYLRPTPAENWDETMRRDLLAELRAAGIDPDKLTDKQLVEQVSRWAMRRSTYNKAFAIWAVHYPDGRPEVYPALRAAFEREKPDKAWSDQEAFDHEALGRGMFYNKMRGSCTSSSIYLTTIFRALGIPTRTVFCIPPFDPRDKAQAGMFYAGVHHHRVRETVRSALEGMNAFANHLFNEVYVGNRWVRLNYSTLGQPILDAKYFGLLTHIFTAADMSQVPLSQTWGVRYFRVANDQPPLSSTNPYRLLAVQDRFGSQAKIENPEVPVVELRTVTIIGALRPGSAQMPARMARDWKPEARQAELFLAIREWMSGADYRQLRSFEQRASSDFLLRAEGHPVLRAKLTGMKMSIGDGSFQGFELRVVPEDKPQIAAGAGYALEPVNRSETYRWAIDSALKPVVLK